jgi:flagellin-like hook-associated protein FlgL
MSGITLSSAVRQNLLSLQNTASLASITQNRLATGKKVNSALDNPVNFFTASGLDSRSNDISNLLDGIGNGVQALKAADTGITSLTNLINTAKSIANQALQAQIGYTTKSNVSTTIGGATSSDLRGTTTYTSATASSNVLYTGTAGGTTAAASTTTLGVATGNVGAVTGSAVSDNTATPAVITTATALYGPSGGAAASGGLTTQAASAFTDGSTFTVDGHTITFKSGAVPAAASAPTGYGVSGNIATDGSGNSIVYLGTGTQSTGTVGDLLNAIDLASGVQNAVIASGAATLSTNTSQTVSNITAGAITVRGSTGADLSITGKADALKALGLTTATGTGNATVSAARTTLSTSLGTLITDGSTLNVNGKTVTFKNAGTPLAANVATGSGVSGNIVTDGSGNSTVYLEKGTVADVLNAIDLATGVKTTTNASGTATLATASGATASSIAASGALQISTGTAADLTISGTGNTLAALGLNGNTGTATTFTASRSAGSGSISGKTLTFTSFNSGTAVNVTFGDGTSGTVKTLDQLNTSLQANNLTATVDTTGKLTISASNDYASSTLGGIKGGAIGGTLTSTLTFTTAGAPVADATSSSTRSGLVSQFNNILSQITTTAQDASYNGVNLLNGDTLKLVFNEKSTSTLSITGVSFTASGLNLSNLTSGTDFVDNASTNGVLTSLNQASVTLRSQASTFGSNLSVVQNRQDFSKNLINVLQTGSSQLTLADTNEEGANLLALQTRQQLSLTSLSLASQADQAVLRLFG